LSAGGFIGSVSPAHAVAHTPPPGCKVEQGYYYGIAQCAYSSYQYRALVRCSDGSWRTGPWINGPSPVWSFATCQTSGKPWIVATDAWVDVPG
jgi:hypothetical protein